ncbi:MAG: hypothetical protein ACHP6H_06645, partial [Legionellales bacterium]
MFQKHFIRIMKKVSGKAILFTAFGCLLLYTSCNNKDNVPDTVTFTEHVAPILYSNCAVCHRPGGTAHFSLVAYEGARKNAGASAYVVKERLMPPWPADPHYTSFVGERMLSDREIKILDKWATEGAPEGPKDKLPALPT